MAQRLKISTSHFSRVFKNTAGETYSEFVGQMRMDMAAHLLKDTSLSIKEIARRIGFQDNVSYFSRKFKAVFGKSPNEFRRHHL